MNHLKKTNLSAIQVPDPMKPGTYINLPYRDLAELLKSIFSSKWKRKSGAYGPRAQWWLNNFVSLAFDVARAVTNAQEDYLASPLECMLEAVYPPSYSGRIAVMPRYTESDWPEDHLVPTIWLALGPTEEVPVIIFKQLRRRDRDGNEIPLRHLTLGAYCKLEWKLYFILNPDLINCWYWSDRTKKHSCQLKILASILDAGGPLPQKLVPAGISEEERQYMLIWSNRTPEACCAEYERMKGEQDFAQSKFDVHYVRRKEIEGAFRDVLTSVGEIGALGLLDKHIRCFDTYRASFPHLFFASCKWISWRAIRRWKFGKDCPGTFHWRGRCQLQPQPSVP